MYIVSDWMSNLDKLTPGSSINSAVKPVAAAAAAGAGAGHESDIEEDEDLEMSVAGSDDNSYAAEGSESGADDSGSESGAEGAEDDEDEYTDTEVGVEEDGNGGGGGADEGDDEEGGSGAAAAASAGSGGVVKQQKKTAKKRGATKKNIEDDLTLLGVPHGLTFDDEDDEDNDDDEPDNAEYFQKLKSSVRDNFVETYHPESYSHNYDEIQTLSRVVRNSAGVIVDDLHKTIPIMTKYEKTRILGQRAKQINEGAQPFIKIDSTVIDGYLIAMKELEQKKTPFIIRRPLPNGGSEYWRIQDLEIL